MTRAQAPGLLALVVGVTLGLDDGGLAAATWSAAGVVLLALALLAAMTGPRPAPPRAVVLSLCGLAAFCVLSYLSVLWADVPADALAEAGKTALYAVAVGLVARAPWPPAALRVALATVAGGATVLALVVLVRTAAIADPVRLFVSGRLSYPIGYANANAGLWLIAFWAAFGLVLAADIPRALRVGALGAACLLLELSLLSQSRGALAAIVVTAVLVVAGARHRLAIIAQLGLVAAATAAAATALLDVRDAVGTPALAEDLSHARWAVALSVAGVLLAAAAGNVLLERHGRRDAVAPALARAERYGPPVLGALALAAALVAIGNPVSWAHRRWDSFTSGGYRPVESGTNRFSGALGSDRHDYYRVALLEFRHHPLTGIGAGNFQVAYFAHRRGIDAPRYPHSLPLQVLAQLGLVGAIAFAVFLLPLVALAVRCARARGPDALPALAALAAFAVWLVHGLTDWLWEFPALSVPALGLLAVAARSGVESALHRPARARRAWWLLPAVPAAGVLAATFVVVGLAGRYADEARDHSLSDPRAAAHWYARAADVDPLDADPLVEEAIVDRRLRRPARARRALGDALDREPQNWFAHLELAMLLGAQGDVVSAADHRRAMAEIRAARRLNPGQIIIAEVRALLARHYRIDPLVVEAKLARRPDRDPRAVDR